MKYNKLVRDKIPEVIKNKGGVPIFHTADDPEYWQKLKEKLMEEVSEFNEAESEEELADVLEVLDAVVAHKKFDMRSVQKIKDKKFEERGGFSEKIILDES